MVLQIDRECRKYKNYIDLGLTKKVKRLKI